MHLPYIQIIAENGETVPGDIERNLTTLLGTRRGELETDRAYGISWAAVDKPIPTAQRMLTLDVVEQIRIYETRCRVVRVTVDVAGVQGIMGMKVVIAI